MDIKTIIASIISSLGISMATAIWLSKQLINHRLTKDIERFKAEWQKELQNEKVIREGEIRKEVEYFLGEKAAVREYELVARKRLYNAIGPLKFQLLLACRDLAGRIQHHGLRKSYSTDVKGYYGKSTLFRILKPLSICELIERQIAFADFSLDNDSINLIRFKKSAFAVFSGSDIIGDHSRVNWELQTEHVYFDYLNRAANALIVDEENHVQRVMMFHEFDNLFNNDEGFTRLMPFSDILKSFSPETKPLFWIRLVGYGYLCNEYINTAGLKIGFESRQYPIRELIMRSKDKEICEEITDYCERCKNLPLSPL